MNKLNSKNINKSIIISLMFLSINIFSINNKVFYKSFKKHNSIKIYAPSSKYLTNKKKHNAEIFLDKINKSKSSIKTAIIKAKVDIIKKYIRIKGDMEINIIFPNKIIINTSVLGITISTLLINGNKLYFKNHIKKTLKVRRATKTNISRYIPIQLSLKQFKEMLRGNAPTINYNKISRNSKKNTLRLKNHREVQNLSFDKENNITKMKLFQNNKKRININFSKIKESNGYKYASKIEFNDYKKNIRSKMNIISIKFNQKIKKDIFNPLSN